MAALKSMLNEFPWNPRYAVSGVEEVLTPACIIYPDILSANIQRTVQLLGGNPDRWRVHIKTAKLGYTVRRLIDYGVRNFKCATTLELLVACECGAADVLLAYPTMGANARRVQEIAVHFAGIRISVLAENSEQVMQWRGSRVGIFLDINPGMNRTGIGESHAEEAVKLARAIEAAGLEFRGLHYYDGHLGGLPEPERTLAAHRGYDHLMKMADAIERGGLDMPELITSGTATFPCSLSYAGFRDSGSIHRASPGTVVYCDATSLAQLPKEYGYQPAVLVLTRIVSRPNSETITCDAGHKAVSADAGVPTCLVVGVRELVPRAPSEEHLPITVEKSVAVDEEKRLQVGALLHLLPRHVCPTVNNFDHALLVRNGVIESMEKITARGREAPLLRTADKRLSP
jgi:D-serine deaminase-like pyridoxal phosphate-dependent protein